ncbi:TPA: phage gp6-like head-tail connector protein [Streptococcus suis]|nr:phage gp6-like head-tail connector protein [Streptococcus suis]HEM5208038.1 phage gp6-like head-tail connector protein [Streptococcus suis]HEM5235383.1 phage gp6-like head-tail connector protein [Streptococcus suis]HEM5241420.1 phage gp6-like head-tail connector protein [Streptococcus suis]
MVEVSDKLLTAFKERMRIFHNVEDDNLRRILAGSQAALFERFGVAVDVIDSGQELILERSRFVYNDKLELFESAFAGELNRFAFVHTLKGFDDESSDEEDFS